jgi:hypothetical protein
MLKAALKTRRKSHSDLYRKCGDDPPCNRNVSIPLCPCVCVRVSIPIRLLAFPLLSAVVPGLSGTLRARGLALTIHTASQ